MQNKTYGIQHWDENKKVEDAIRKLYETNIPRKEIF